MNKERHVLRPAVECCEPRAMLSGGAVSALATPLAASPAAARVIRLAGTVHDHFHQHSGAPDTGSIFQFKGGGKLSGFGDPTVSGRIHTIGLIAQGQAAGYLILKGGGGTLTLNVIGPEQINGPEGLPDVFAFTTGRGTGKFKHLFDSGSIRLVSTPPGQTIGGTHGAVKLVFTSDPVPGT